MLMAVLCCTVSLAQSGEFKTHPNGLIYSKNTMHKLAYIVDSLNLKFKSCDVNKTFFSKYQTVGHIVKLSKGNIKQAKNDIDNNISLEDFKAKYPGATIEENVLVVRFSYTNYKDVPVVEFSEINLEGDYGFDIRIDKQIEKYNGKKVPRWVFEYYKRSEYREESIKAFFFPGEFKSQPLTENYARMIGYADCLIDTTATKFNDNIKSGWVHLPENWTALSKRKQQNLLEKMRKTRVVGTCSMDSRPREHAINIAMLSAETTHWEVFLRAHLDIMNDRFERVSDGSYAWAGRKTYIKELEELKYQMF